MAPTASISKLKKRLVSTLILIPFCRTASKFLDNQPSFIFSSRLNFETSLHICKSSFSSLIKTLIPIQFGAFKTFEKYSG